jgi:uncharacterized protein YjbI with pentapeptide repeats
MKPISRVFGYYKFLLENYFKGFKKHLLISTAFIVVAVLIIITIIWGYNFSITGFNTQIENIKSGQQIQPAKTIWDWLQLLIVPMVLTIGGLLFSRRQQLNEQARSEDMQQEAALQSYIDRISKLIIENKLDDPNSSVALRSIAKALTVTTAKRLNPERKGHLIQFLYETGLIKANGGSSILDMQGVDLTKTRLIVAHLPNINLSGANFCEAFLHRVNFRGAYLEETCFCKAILSESNFESAHLYKAHLEEANLTRATMTDASLERVNAKKANLSYTIFNDVNLMDADLTEANFYHAILLDTDIFSSLTQNTNFEKAIFDEEYRDYFSEDELKKITILNEKEAKGAKEGVIEDLFSDYVLAQLRRAV